MENKEYKRNCPECGKEMIYTTEKILKAAIRDNKMCKSCALKKRYSNPEERKKASIIHKKSYSNDPSIKEKLSIANIKRFSDPKERQKTSQGSKKAWSDLELRKKASDKSAKFYSNPKEIKKMSNAVKIALHRPDVRKKHIEGLLNSKWIKVKTDKGQLEMINKWNGLGFKFEPNYQVHTDTDLFYIDGYDKNKNVVLEYDSKYHQKFGWIKKDLVRQNKIIELLKPKKFWRYDAVNKTWRNII